LVVFSDCSGFYHPERDAKSGKFILRQDTQNEVKQDAIGQRRFYRPIEYRKLQNGISRPLCAKKPCSRRDEARDFNG
jgi:hypothetical protein